MEGYHLMTCKYTYGGGPVCAHNTMMSGWSECLSDLLIHHQLEPRHRYVDSEDRPDISFYDANLVIMSVGKESKRHRRKKEEVEFKNYWRRRMSIILQKCNSRVILRKLSRLSVYRLDNENILAIDKDIQSSIHYT